MHSELLVFNGINALTGDYFFPALSTHDIAKVALGEQLDPDHLRELRRYRERSLHKSLGPIEGIDPNNLEETGWGVIFPQLAAPELREALRPLLDHRKAQVGNRYREFCGSDGYRAGESKSDFLTRHRHGPGPVDPERVPYYLLLVGDPETIPYRFQYLLDVQFAVGRISFNTVPEYAAYALSVVRAETRGISCARRAVFFGARNAGDQATQMSADELVAPLAQKVASLTAQVRPDWAVQTIIGADALRARLQNLIGGDETPQLLFTASHGIGFPCGHQLQLAHQGALVCQDWLGPLQHRGPIPRDHYLAGEDIDGGSDLTGMIAFFFACFGGGTPRLDDFAHKSRKNPAPIAPQAFVAALPQRMLGLPAGGALAVVAHVERAWEYSFRWPGAGPQRAVFESTLQRLLKGVPLGHALEFFNAKYAELSTMISAELEDIKFGATPDELQLARMWTALNDARSYVIVGDPAVRLQ